jgi:mannose-6-phosphate isomerase-like protein (cupin superfamily)
VTADHEKVNLADKFAGFSDHWSPKLVGQVNDFAVKLVKLEGAFVWHQHDDTDEMFLVVAGRLCIRLRDRDIDLEAGEFFIVPRGVEHLPVAEDECQVLLFEPTATLNTGNVHDQRTVTRLETI